jgi:ABC-type transporter Mla subunit MlaD
MAAIFQIRRGTTNESLSEGELYLHKGSGSLQFGSGSTNYNVLTLNAPVSGDVILTGNITASNAYFTGDVAISGNLFLGNASNDTITAGGEFTSNLIPNPTNTYSLGSSTKVWKEIHAASISGAIAATNGVISGSSQLNTSFEEKASETHTLVSGSSQIIGILDSLNDFSESVTASLESIYQTTSSLNDFSESVTASLESIYETTASLNSFSASVTSSLESIYQTTSSLNDFSASVTTSLESIYQTTSSLNEWSASAKVKLSNLESKSSSVDTSLEEIHSYTSSLKQAISVDGQNLTILGDLIVEGTTTQIDSTQVNIGENIIELNYGGNAHQGGIYVKDATGANEISGSILWDGDNDFWKAGAKGFESKILLADGDGILSSSLQLTQLNNTTESLNQTTASLNDFSASVTSSLESIYQTTASLNLFSASVTASLESIYQTTSSLNDFSASVTASLESIYQTTASLNNYTSSTNDDLASLHQTTASLNDFSASVTASLESIYQTTASLNDFSASVTASLESIYQTTASLNVVTESLNYFSESVTASLESIYQTTASLNDSTASLNYFSASVTASLESIYQTTASLNQASASLFWTASDHEQRLDDLRYDVDLLTPAGLSAAFDALNQATESLQIFTSSFSASVSASLAELSASSGYINYVTNSIEQLTGIEVADFDNNVAVTFINGTLKFIFGTPALPSSIGASLSGFLIDRFNNVNDAYSINGTWSNQGYTLISASLYEGSTLLTQVGSGTSLSYNATTSGSHTYRLEYTASSPLDGSLYKTSTTTTGTISKSNPASPTLTPTPTVQLGAASNQIEQGATGSISFTSASADPSNSWNLVNTTTNVNTPYFVTGSATGSTSISITATANYASPTGDNIPDLTTTSTTTTTYTKIRSLRYGASDLTAFTAGELENLALWDTTLGGGVGTIIKGTTNPSGQSVTIAWSGDKYHYIAFDSSRSNLSNITTSGFGVLGQFSVTTVGQYKVYKTNTLQAGGAGSSITYTLT